MNVVLPQTCKTCFSYNQDQFLNYFIGEPSFLSILCKVEIEV